LKTEKSFTVKDELSSRERMLRTLKGEPVDRVPVLPPFRWAPWDSLEDPDLPAWRKTENYRIILRAVEQCCDFRIRTKCLEYLSQYISILAPPSCVQIEERKTDRGTCTTTFIHTPKGTLRREEIEEEGLSLDHKWQKEVLVKDATDAEKLLTLKDEYESPDFSALKEEVERIGERGLLAFPVPSPILVASEVMDFTMFLEWTLTEKALLERMIDTACQRIYSRLETVLSSGLIPLVRFAGMEQATPPMMSSTLFDDLVVKYDRILYDLVHRHDAFVQVHCHGRVKSILKKLIDMGVDALDPVEPPPQGDVEIGQAKRIVDGKMTLVGNIEYQDLELGTAEEIDRKVREAITSERKDHFMLYPSAMIFTLISDRHRDNILQYIESGLRYGAMDNGSVKEV
jgi:uroporphyrinogen-III decarboxylase